MSRKAEEVKVRVTTLEKGWWQEAAAFEGTTVSELIRRTMNEQILRRPNGAPSATPIAGQIEIEPEPEADVDCSAFPAPAEHLSPAAPTFAQVAAWMNAPSATASAASPQPTPVRREVTCSCGKPTFLFCRVCDV